MADDNKKNPDKSDVSADSLLDGLGDLPADDWSLVADPSDAEAPREEPAEQDAPKALTDEEELEDVEDEDEDEDEDSEDEDSEDEDEDEDEDLAAAAHSHTHSHDHGHAHSHDHGHGHAHAAPAPRAVATSVSGNGPLEGMLALFDHPDDILHAAEKVRDQKFQEWDVLTPFPVHGMDEAMGIGRSWMPYVTFLLGATGLATALFIQFGTMAFDWPIIVSGKPFAAWPSFIPISFELTVLFAGVGTAIIMLLTAGLPKLKPKIHHPRLSSDRFGIWISAEDHKFDADKTRTFLESLHPLEVQEIRGES